MGLKRKLWQQTDGSGVTVAVMDSGLAAVRSLNSNLLNSFKWDGREESPRDKTGHGTRCASLIASQRTRAPGIAPGAGLISIRVMDAKQKALPNWVKNAFELARELEVDIVSCSFTLPEYDEQLDHAVMSYINAGGLVVAASGNKKRHRRHEFPRLCRPATAVGATTNRLRPMVTTKDGAWLDVYAPGQRLPVLTPPRGRVKTNFGKTSGATALIAGVAALGLGLAETAEQRQDMAWAFDGILRKAKRPLPGASSNHAGLIHISLCASRVEKTHLRLS